jgi:hypothetical protein
MVDDKIILQVRVLNAEDKEKLLNDIKVNLVVFFIHKYCL